MKNFSGEIRKENGLVAQIHDRTVRFFAKLQPTERLSAKIAKVDKPFNGRWYDKIRFSGSVSRIPAIYRFLKAWSKFFSKHEAKALTAPAKLIEIDTALVDKADAKPSAHEAKCVTIDQKARIVGFVNLRMSWLALLKFIKGIRMKNNVRVIVADGRIAKYRKALKLNRSTRIASVDSAIIKSRLNKVQNAIDATTITAEAECVEYTEEVPVGKTATAEVADGVDLSINRAMVHSYKAAPYAWFLSEYTDGTLHIYQCMSGVQSADSVEIDTEEESVYWANAMVSSGVMSLVFAQTEPQESGELELI